MRKIDIKEIRRLILELRHKDVERDKCTVSDGGHTETGSTVREAGTQTKIGGTVRYRETWQEIEKHGKKWRYIVIRWWALREIGL